MTSIPLAAQDIEVKGVVTEAEQMNLYLESQSESKEKTPAQ